MGHVLVTGGSRGIGAAIVRRLLAEGHHASFTFLQDGEAAARLIDEQPRALAIRADVRDSGAVDDVFAHAEGRHGPVTHLVNNAGITGPLGPFSTSTEKDLRDIFDVNLFGTASYCRAAISRWTRSRHAGVIVNVSSTAATTGAPGEYVGYAASKAAVDALTLGLGREVGRAGIRVVGVAPGTTHTGIHAAAGDPDRPGRTAERAPLGRAAEPDEIARVVAWALSDAASYVTAVTIPVSGGL
ncbi:oxidoreductase [Naasia aerilata]|uniref:Oxidoreductase n=2 Tax=Naasia aerilata TaxID=1162966 RepID=A0ABN6XUX9_9MICO|nr:oxidoreductase [Naasia aerilata]